MKIVSFLLGLIIGLSISSANASVLLKVQDETEVFAVTRKNTDNKIKLMFCSPSGLTGANMCRYIGNPDGYTQADLNKISSKLGLKAFGRVFQELMNFIPTVAIFAYLSPSSVIVGAAAASAGGKIVLDPLKARETWNDRKMIEDLMTRIETGEPIQLNHNVPAYNYYLNRPKEYNLRLYADTLDRILRPFYKKGVSASYSNKVFQNDEGIE